MIINDLTGTMVWKLEKEFLLIRQSRSKLHPIRQKISIKKKVSKPRRESGSKRPTLTL